MSAGVSVVATGFPLGGPIFEGGGLVVNPPDARNAPPATEHLLSHLEQGK